MEVPWHGTPKCINQVNGSLNSDRSIDVVNVEPAAGLQSLVASQWRAEGGWGWKSPCGGVGMPVHGACLFY